MQEHLPSIPANASLPKISEAKRDLLARYLRGELKQQPTSTRTITPRPPDAIPRLSFAQERLWFLEQLNPGSAVYNVPLAVRLSGPIDPGVLEESVNEIVRRHEALRTTFATVDGRPVLSICSQLQVDLRIQDLQSLPSNHQEAHARMLLNEESATPFDLTQGPLIRTTLFKLDEQQHIFLVVMHHIVSDGWSLVLFFRELSAIYEAFSCGKPCPLPEVTIQYADYADWQREWLQGDVLQAQLTYWKKQLDGELPILELPTDRPRPAVQIFSGAREWLVLSEKLTESIMALGQREGATSFMILLAAFKALLYRYTGQEDVIVGSPIANRPQTETESIVGFFLNNLALRTDLSGQPSFRELLTRVRRTALEAYANQDVPFEKLIEALKPERDLSRTPIFQVYFNLFNFAEEIRLPGSGTTVSFVEAWENSDEELSKFDLTLYAGLQGRKLKLAFVYNRDLFDVESIESMLVHFKTLLETVVSDPGKCIADLSLESEIKGELEGSRTPLVRPTSPFIEFQRDEIEQSIAARFCRQVAQYPKQLAVKSRNHEWTYEHLNGVVDRIAQSMLIREAKEERIALLFEHDAPMIAAMLAVLRVGKTYVPVDPNHPKERLTQIIEHSQSGVILTNNKNLALGGELAKSGVALINIDDLDLDKNGLPAVEFPVVEPGRLAYILYTSGSTGEPKGVMQNHRNVLHYIRVYTNNLHLNSDDRLTLLSSYCFDASVMDIYGALLNGATLYPIDLKEDGLAGLAEQVIDEEITVYHSTPTVYRYFLGALADRKAKSELTSFPKVRLVVLGGEKVNRTDVELYQQHFAEHCLFVNGLGPTEATVSLQNFINKQTKLSGDNVPVGFAVDHTEVLLLNQAGKPSEGFGEIAIKSAHVALGYWRNTDATAKAFYSSNGSHSSRVAQQAHYLPTRIYRTGDMGRRLPNGSIRFEGRKDFQVKIRGFRVELGEIESALAQYPRVREGVVVADENGSDDKRLIAYVVPRDQSQETSGTAKTSIGVELHDFLKQKLPEYMVPSSFVMLAALPLTPSGKLDRRALPAPGTSDTRQDDPRRAAQDSPQTPVEKLLAVIWMDLLGVETIGANDNFFELGGHSLLAVRLFAQIEKRLGKRLPLATLFQAPTIAQLAAVIQKDWTPEWSSLVEIQPIQTMQSAASKPVFFCVHALGGNVLEYYPLARHLGEDQPFYGLQSAGLNGDRPPHTRVEDMATHYIKEMRELQPEGPYFIGGRSLGGMVAFEMAQQLRAQGQTIGLLALLDTYPSGYAKLFRNEATVRAALRRGLSRTQAHLANLGSLAPREKLSYVAKKARFAPIKIRSQIWRRIYKWYENLGRPLPRMLKDIEEFNSLAVRNYTPRVYDGEVTLFWASADLRTSLDLVKGWRALAAGGIEVQEIPGSHLDIVKEPHVGELAKKLSSCLTRAHARSSLL